MIVKSARASCALVLFLAVALAALRRGGSATLEQFLTRAETRAAVRQICESLGRKERHDREGQHAQ